MDERPHRATRFLPANYVQIGRLDLIKDKRLLVTMNILGLALLVGFGWLFSRVALYLRPEAADRFWRLAVYDLGDFWRLTGAVLGVMAAVVALHEAAHGLFFWLFTRSRPRFEFKIVYASASAPGWYLPRRQYIIVGLAPLVLLSLFGVLALWLVPPGWLQMVTVFLVMNASGAVGDLVVVAWMLFRPRASLALDESTAITLFAPEPPQ
ncbi:MAG: DUF3267 domain-containing protein [Anaerolineae bacterium]|nr:DUF3267 domain-containing protein [Anaerolineae bacterium]